MLQTSFYPNLEDFHMKHIADISAYLCSYLHGLEPGLKREHQSKTKLLLNKTLLTTMLRNVYSFRVSALVINKGRCVVEFLLLDAAILLFARWSRLMNSGGFLHNFVQSCVEFGQISRFSYGAENWPYQMEVKICVLH